MQGKLIQLNSAALVSIKKHARKCLTLFSGQWVLGCYLIYVPVRLWAWRGNPGGLIPEKVWLSFIDPENIKVESSLPNSGSEPLYCRAGAWRSDQSTVIILDKWKLCYLFYRAAIPLLWIANHWRIPSDILLDQSALQK